MGKDTLKGTVKISSYIVAFMLMVGIHVAMDKIGSKTKEQVELYSTMKDDNLAKADLLQDDSLRDTDNEIDGRIEKVKDTICLEN